jgi:hypothetical protein
MAVTPPVATAAQVLTDIRYEVKDTDSTNYTDAELVAYINEAVRNLTHEIAVSHPDFWLASGQAYTATSNILANTEDYDLPAAFYQMLRVQVTDSAGDNSLLYPIDLDRAADVDAKGYMLIYGHIYLYPTPTVAVTSGLLIHYVATPAEVTAADTTAAVPLSGFFEDMIRQYAVLKCKMRQGESSGDFGQIYELAKRRAAALITATNVSDKAMGLSVHWRSYV